MPKILEDIQEKILDTVRERVAMEGWDALNIRALAKQCGIASGTVYNYFPSREAIIAAVIDRDWREAEEKILGRIHQRGRDKGDMKNDALDNLRFLYETLAGFMGVYRRLWAESPGHLSGDAWKRGERERQGFRSRMEDLVKTALSGAKAGDGIDNDFLVSFLARSVVLWSGEANVDFSRLEPILSALLA